MTNVLVKNEMNTPRIGDPDETVFHYQWEWDLKASPEQLWPYVADTNRFDKDAGLPAYDKPEESSTAGFSNARRRLSVTLYGIPISWVEEPFQWIRPFRFGVTRNYETGPIPFLQPIKQLRVLAELRQKRDGGTHLTYNVWVTPRNWLGRIAIPLQIGRVYARNFERVFLAYDKLAVKSVPFEAVPANSMLTSGAQRRLESQRRELIRLEQDPGLVDKLLTLVMRADDLSLSQIRPYLLARQWEAERADVLALMLQATRTGLLDFKWDLLCPMCRAPKESAETLADVTKTVHCETCNIDYRANFDQSVELTFTPNPAIRQIPEQVIFCSSGPESAPHIAIQQLLRPGESRTVEARLEVGRYQLRSSVTPGNQLIEVSPEGEAEAAYIARAAHWDGHSSFILPAAYLTLTNDTDQENLLMLERVSWADHAVTAAEVTTLQQFRDLFSEEALRPGDQISVGSLTVLFTDLCDSTRMYQEIGDAPAFGLVMDHFDVLVEAVRAEGGAVVKTIGDSVMAVFLRPVSAIRAVSRAQSELKRLTDVRPLRLKASIHHGPSIAVTLNERLDYFGSTINIAARLEKFAQGGDIVISESVFHDPEVQDYVNNQDDTLQMETFGSTLKGFDNQSFNLHRISLL